MTFEIRPATCGDAVTIAKVHTTVWCATYAKTAPKKALEALSFQRRLEDWENALCNGLADFQTLVATDRGDITGFIHFSATNPPLGKIQYLYISRTSQGQGIGKALMARAFFALINSGCTSAELAVVDSNDQALGFYKSLNGCVQDELVTQGFFWRSDNRIIKWNDLGILTQD